MSNFQIIFPIDEDVTEKVAPFMKQRTSIADFLFDAINCTLEKNGRQPINPLECARSDNELAALDENDEPCSLTCATLVFTGNAYKSMQFFAATNTCCDVGGPDEWLFNCIDAYCDKQIKKNIPTNSVGEYKAPKYITAYRLAALARP